MLAVVGGWQHQAQVTSSQGKLIKAKIIPFVIPFVIEADVTKNIFK